MTGPSTDERRDQMSDATSRAEQVKGRVKQAAGDLTDDDDLKRSGTADKVSGSAKEKAEQAKEKVDDAIDRAKDALTGD
jgi:uncharacterized protein YjbJ (UPF0337 family)